MTDSNLTIQPKFVGQRRIVEMAVASLTTDAALLLTGPPGCGKSWLSELLCAAICNDSSLLIQGCSGLSDEVLRYGWNYAKLLNEGPGESALIPSPVLRAIQAGQLVRIEELTRIPNEVQDSLLSILSEKAISIPELKQVIRARPGFNLIATTNQWDRGTFEPSSALMRRFCVIELPLPSTLDEELQIIMLRLDGRISSVSKEQLQEHASSIISILRDLRSGVTADGKYHLAQPGDPWTVTDGLSVVQQGLSLMSHFLANDSNFTPFAYTLNHTALHTKRMPEQTWKDYLLYLQKHSSECSELARNCLQALKQHA